MELQPFNDAHAQQLKSWFDSDIPENKYISFYADTEHWLEVCDGESRVALAAMSLGQMIGFADIEFGDNGQAHFSFGIDPALRRRGIGRNLLDRIEQYAAKHGAQSLVAGVEHDNAASIRIMQTSGYTPVSTSGNVTEYVKKLS